jgi:U3 small nucleolar ribonucleoprotein protein IMP4
MILLTTSHRPTRRVRSLCNDLACSIPGLVRVNRGKTSFFDLAEKAVQMKIEKIVVVDRWKGGPGRIRLFRIIDGKIKECAPRLYISGVKLKREFMASKEISRKLIKCVFLDSRGIRNGEVEKLASSLSEFFEVPIFKAEEALSNYDAYLCFTRSDDCLAYISFYVLPSNAEIGPRIKISQVAWQV